MTITVKITTKSKESKIEQVDKFEYKAHITAAPVKGQANQQLIKLLVEYFQIRPYQVVIKAGHHSPSKIIEIVGYPE